LFVNVNLEKDVFVVHSINHVANPKEINEKEMNEVLLIYVEKSEDVFPN